MATQNYFKVKNGLEFPSIETLQTTDNTGPSIKPSLNLDFAKTKVLDPRVTFTRASAATYYDGETTALAEQNVMLYSQDATQWANISNTYVGNNASVAPDGTTTAALVTPNTTNARHIIYRRSETCALNVPYTYSVYMKAAGYNYGHIGLFVNSAGCDSRYVIDLTTGIITSSYLEPYYRGTGTASCVYAGNGWYRVIISISGLAWSGTTSHGIVMGSSNTGYPQSFDAGSPQFAGDGVNGIYWWGAQIEQRSYATAYTPTTTSSITNYIPVLQTAASNTARFDHDPVTGESKGLLIEEQRTNLLTYSEQFDNAAWTKGNTATVLANTTASPDGTISSDTLTGTGMYPYVQGSVTYTAAAYTFSVFVKKSTGTFAIAFSAIGGADEAAFNLATGATISVGANISSSGCTDHGFYWRVWAVSTRTAGAANPRLFAGYPTNANPVVWGAQLEAGSFPTSYIPTLLTYTGRASTATYKAADGLIRTAAANVARYEPNASGGSNLLLESASSNVLNYTEVIDLALTSRETAGSYAVSRNAGLAPDGSYTANKLRNISTDDYTAIYRGGFPAAGTYTMSVWMRSDTTTTAKFVVYDQGLGNAVTVTPTWQRFTFTETVTAPASCNPQIRLLKNVDVYVWGLQLESGTAATSYIPSVETFTGRSSTATYYDSTGTIRTAASGQPRYTYNPSMLTAAPKLLLENAATNQRQYSEQLDNAYWSKINCTVTANSAVAPDGTTTADKIVETAVSGERGIFKDDGGALTAGTYTFSVYVKAAGRNYAQIRMSPNSSGSNYWASCIFDLVNGVFTQTQSVNYTPTFTSLSVGNGWYRLSCTITTSTAGPGSYTTVNPCNAATATFASYGGVSYTGDGSSGIYVWGMQLETGYAATSYIPTTSATVTRAADTSTSAAQTRAADVYSSSQVTRSGEFTSMTGSNFSSWWKKNEGTLYAEGTPVHPTAYTPNAMLIGTMADNRQAIELRYSGTDTSNIRCENVYNGSSNSSLLVSASGSRTRKIAYAFTPGDFAATCNAASPSTNSITAIDNPNAAYIGYTPSYSSTFNGTIRKVAYYPKRLSNAELVSITS